jgi:acetolactate synthase-1/2/3 large subunit
MKCTPWYAVVQALQAEGVEYVFGLPGDPRHLITDLVSSSNIKFVLVRHEASAVSAAYAYARVTGKAGVCFTSPGPGTGNFVTGLLEATSGCLPIIALANGTENCSYGMGAFQELDARSLMKPVTKWAVRVTDPAKVPWVIQRAFMLATNGKPGAIFIEIPSDIGLAPAEIADYEPCLGRQRMRPDAQSVKAAARLLSQSARPLLLCGSGAVASGAADQVKALSDAAGIPVFTTPGGRGIMSEGHDLSLGQVGLYFTDVGKSYYDKADLIFSVGSRLEAFSTGSWQFFPKAATFIQLDIDPNTIAMNWRPDVAMVGDAALALADLLDELRPQVNRSQRDKRIEEIKNEKSQYFKNIEQEVNQKKKPIRPPQVVSAINKVFGHDTILVNENGATDLWCYCWPYYKVLDVGDCVPMAEQTAMGLGVVGTIGAKLGQPSKKVVCVTGDGALQMAMMELATAAELKCGVTWVVMNNQCLGWPQYHQVLTGQPQVGTSFEVSPDFVSLAESQGCKGIGVTDPEQVEPALTEALRANQEGVPVLIDFHIAKHDYPKHFVEMNRQKHATNER